VDAVQTFSQLPLLWGEYARNACELALRLWRHTPNIEVGYFNFYDPLTYDVLERFEPPIVVFTAHAIEQLPRSTMVFDSLFRYRKKIQVVFHFEPLYQVYDETLLGLMRRRYVEVNDYNRDRLSELQSRPYIRIVHLQPDVLRYHQKVWK
jgi:hypothetical protein